MDSSKLEDDVSAQTNSEKREIASEILLSLREVKAKIHASLDARAVAFCKRLSTRLDFD